MTAIVQATAMRKVYFHDPVAPVASLVVPTAFVAVRGPHGSLLLVRRCDSGAWERETRAAAWGPVAGLPGLSIEPRVRLWIAQALAIGRLPHIG
jgi:hypothetical protein